MNRASTESAAAMLEQLARRLQEHRLRLESLNAYCPNATDELRGLRKGRRNPTVGNLALIAQAVCHLVRQPSLAGEALRAGHKPVLCLDECEKFIELVGEFPLAFAAGHPLKLQIGCYHVHENRLSGGSFDGALQSARREARELLPRSGLEAAS